MNNESQDTPNPDSLWHPEEWRGRWIVVRNIPVGDEGSQATKRETLNASKFSAFALVFEDEGRAQAAAAKANAGEEVPRSVPQDDEDDD